MIDKFMRIALKIFTSYRDYKSIHVKLESHLEPLGIRKDTTDLLIFSSSH